MRKHAITAPLAIALAGCYGGNPTEDIDTVKERDLSGIAMPGDPTQLAPVPLIPRDLFGSDKTVEALGYPTLSDDEKAIFSPALTFFVTEHTVAEGIGPLFNQPRCLGCHQSNDDIAKSNLPPSPPATLNIVSTPFSRGARQGVTDYSQITADQRPPTAAFTLYGDFSAANGVFDSLPLFGGPLQHVKAVGSCDIDVIPPESMDPNLEGGTDPVTGEAPTGFRRATGERAAPPYVGRGLMEAIYFGDIVANEDPSDTVGHNSSLLPAPDPTICPGDCISGRHNENHADGSFVGGDPIIRVGRFGLRGTGPTLLQFVVGGMQGEIGLTSPFAPTEQNNVEIADKGCDIVPDPEVKADLVMNVRSLIRMLGIPEYPPELTENPPTSPLAMDVQAGAALFGVDMDAFRSRITPGATPTNMGDPDADHAIAKDRQLNCVGCHIPIIKTGQSPAAYGGEILSNKWAPLFSDLLIHKMTSFPPLRDDHIVPPPPPGLNRNLADFAVPASVTGLAGGDEWRTPPLMGLGKTGAPFLHDARVYLNTSSPATTLYSNSMGANATLVIDDLDKAVQAAIELHDLPVAPNGDDSQCPQVMSAQLDICTKRSPNRSEARNTIERWHALTPQQQLQVIKFLESL